VAEAQRLALDQFAAHLTAIPSLVIDEKHAASSKYTLFAEATPADIDRIKTAGRTLAKAMGLSNTASVADVWRAERERDGAGCAECKRLPDLHAALQKLGQYRLQEGDPFDRFNTKLTAAVKSLHDVVHHKYQFGHQLRAFDRTLSALTSDEEMLCMDFAAKLNLHRSAQLTQAEARECRSAALFGVERYFRAAPGPDEKKNDIGSGAEDPAAEGLRQEHWLYITEEEQSDSYYALCALDHFLGEARKRGVRRLTLWSDNGSGFHSGEFVVGLRQRARDHQIVLEGAFFAPGEGKSDNDR
jgi:hypothetical protein